MIAFMKNLIKLLKASMVILALVLCVAIVKQQMSSVVNQAVLSENKNNNETKQEATADGINNLPTISQMDNSTKPTVTDSSGMKSNYKPVTGNGEVIDGNVVAGSEAGVSYDFPENMYPYRAMLSDSEKLVYDQVYEAVDARKDSIDLCRQLGQTEISDVMTAVFNDHPECFWLDTAYTYGYTSKGAVVNVTFLYNETLNAFQTNNTTFLNAASGIINTASLYASDLEKEKSVYQQLQDMVTYDENAELNQSAYSAIVNKITVCAGYARAFQYIMQKLNIPCYFCSGIANAGNHAWNIVCIDGKYYNVDLSWDDTIGEAIGEDSFSYYNLSDNTFSIDHKRAGLSLKLPNCNSASPSA